MIRRLKLTFPQSLIKEPILFTMAKEFDVVPNIRRARVTEDAGEIILEFKGDDTKLEGGIRFLKDKGVEVELIEGDIIE